MKAIAKSKDRNSSAIHTYKRRSFRKLIDSRKLTKNESDSTIIGMKISRVVE